MNEMARNRGTGAPPAPQTVTDLGFWERVGIQLFMRILGQIARQDQGPKSGAPY